VSEKARKTTTYSPEFKSEAMTGESNPPCDEHDKVFAIVRKLGFDFVSF